jgi:HAMP domain-containing protein
VINMGDNKDSTGLIILGIVLGAILAFALLNRRTQTLQPIQPVQQIQPVQPIQSQQWQPMDIPKVDDIKPQYPITQQKQTDSIPNHIPNQTVDHMASQLEKATSQLENATSKLQETVSKLQQNNVTQPPYIVLQPQTISQPPHVTVQPLQQDQFYQPNYQSHIEQDNLQQDQFHQPNTIYKNDEKWVIRDVKKNG